MQASATTSSVCQLARRRSQANIAPAAASDKSRIGSGEIVRFDQSARYARMIADASRHMADAATTSAPVRPSVSRRTHATILNDDRRSFARRVKKDDAEGQRDG